MGGVKKRDGAEKEKRNGMPEGKTTDEVRDEETK